MSETEAAQSLEASAILSACIAAMNAGRVGEAEARLSSLLSAQPHHPGALYLGAAIAFERKDWNAAEEILHHALEGAPDQPRVLLLLWKTLRAQGRGAEAAALYRSITESDGPLPRLWAEYADALAESGDMAGAEQLHGLAWQTDRDPAAALKWSRLLQASGRAAEAEPLLRSALDRPGADGELIAELEHQLGLALKAQHKTDAALAQMRIAGARAPLGRRQSLERASLLRQHALHDEAIAIYGGLLRRDPLDLDTHLLLNELLHSLGETRELLSSYDEARRRMPGAAEIPCAKGLFLLKLRRPSEARTAFETAIRLSPLDPRALSGLARALEQSGDLDGADAAYARSTATGANGDALEAHASFLLRQEEVTRALGMAQAATHLRPESQGAWALLGLCWRRSGSARADWLNDHDRHIRVFDLDPPDGYPDMAAFNRDLAESLEQAHETGRQYLTQTLRGGTQTHEEMFYNGHALADRLLPRLTQAVQRYVLAMTGDPAHPLTSRRGRGFRYAGSWSSQLRSAGFHTNHIHRKGWISSCYYVAAPDIAADPASQQGWLKFGEPSEEFGRGFAPCRTVQPVPGRLVLFPSYMWHGTTAFHAPQKRLTMAFDAIPA